MAREKITTPQSQRRNGTPTALDRLCLVCPLPDCFQKSKGCLQKPDNRIRGFELLKIGGPDENS